ncbi:hypothetical protein pb186bvf_009541 [Paramecium bursaria]
MQCEECEESNATINCTQCGQILCLSCDKKIHNKGKRVLHQREQIDRRDSRHEQQKERFKQMALPNVDVVTFKVNIPVETNRRFLKMPMVDQVELYLFKRAQQGELMIAMSDFQRYFKNMSSDYINHLEQINLINLTTRKFGDSAPFLFISLHLEELTLQALYWILLNIRKDEMTPTDKLVMSRIKECYGIKLNIQDWNQFLAGLYKIQDQKGLITFNCLNAKGTNEQYVIKMTKCPLDLIKQDISNSSSQLQNSNDALLLFTIEDGAPWIMMDAQQMTSQYKLQWRQFIIFLKDFFDNSVSLTMSQDTQGISILNTSQSSQQSGTQSVPTQKENYKWIRSVELGVQKQELNQSYLSSQTQKKKNKKGLIKPPKSIQKAIPGGKYGCAQLLKCCGPLELRLCTLGLLGLLIQEAINRSILIYYKTLLIKPNTNIAFDFVDYAGLFDDENQNQFILDFEQIPQDKLKIKEDQEDKLKQIQQVVQDILMEYKKGVSLARLPKLIQRKINFNFDLHELGFTKLKCFIQSIQNVQIVNDGTTYASVILDFDAMNKQQPSQELLFKIDQSLRQLIAQNSQGILSSNLLNLLQQQVQNQFDLSYYACQTFEEFLVKHADSYSDVMVKKKGCFVYPKQQYQQQQWTTQHPHNIQVFHHQKSQSTQLPYNVTSQNQSSQLVKAESFLAGMATHTYEMGSQSLTFQSFNANPQIVNNFFMIHEESSQNEIDANVKFIDELLQEPDRVEEKNKIQIKPTDVKYQSLYWKNPQPNQLYSWDFDQ